MRVNHKRAGPWPDLDRDQPGRVALDGAITAPSLLCFLARLVRDATGKVFLILDRLPVHRASLAVHEAEIEVFYLPEYSPELNPDEKCQRRPEAGSHRAQAQAVEAARPGAQLLRAQDISLCRVGQDHPGWLNSYRCPAAQNISHLAGKAQAIPASRKNGTCTAQCRAMTWSAKVTTRAT